MGQISLADRGKMIRIFFAALIKFTWLASAGPAPVDSYKLCIGTTPGVCTVQTSATATEKTIDLDIGQVWYATVRAVNQYGESDPSGQVIVGKPQAPLGLGGKLSN